MLAFTFDLDNLPVIVGTLRADVGSAILKFAFCEGHLQPMNWVFTHHDSKDQDMPDQRQPLSNLTNHPEKKC